MNQSLKIWNGTTQNLDNKQKLWYRPINCHGWAFQCTTVCGKVRKAKVLWRIDTIPLVCYCKLSRTPCKAIVGKVFRYKRAEYPNLCIVASLVMCLSESNSTVERAFSLLTLLLTDRRLSLTHDTISDLMTINVNDKLWTLNKKIIIIKAAAEARTVISKKKRHWWTCLDIRQ